MTLLHWFLFFIGLLVVAILLVGGTVCIAEVLARLASVDKDKGTGILS